MFTPYSTLNTSATPAGFGVLSYVIPIADFFERNPLPHTGPSKFCLSDPKVQAAAANLQTVMNTTIGVLSALTSGFWGGLGKLTFPSLWLARFDTHEYATVTR